MPTLALLVRQLLAPATGVTVLQAPPGSGKTREVIQAIVETKNDRKILWAVRDTVGRDGHSLAEETKLAFTNASAGRITPRIILGLPHFQGDMRAYLKQFRWNESVLIVSHAHIPLVFHTDAPRKLRVLQEAALLVIDEDPLSSLLLHMGMASGDLQPWPLNNFQTTLAPVRPLLADGLLQTTDGLSHALLTDSTLHDRIDRQVPLGQKAVVQCAVRGELFWELTAPILHGLLVNGHRRQLVTAVTQHLKASGDSTYGILRAGRDAALMVDALETDLNRHEQGDVTRRFGWHWRETSGVPETIGLHADLLRPLTSLPQTLVLDAYADLGQYQRLFPEEDCKIVVPDGGSRPIHILFARDARFDRLDLQRRRNLRKHRLLLQDIAQDVHRAERRQLLIVPKTVRDYLMSELRALSPATSAQTALVDVMHWHAGRGQNAFAGWDVRALTCPHLPVSVRDATLSALYPSEQEREARQALWHHLERSELLQMVQRGRQIQSPAESAPRIITHFPPCDLCSPHEQHTCDVLHHDQPRPCSRWQGTLTVGLYTPTVVIRSNSRNPRLGQTIKETAEVLDQRLHGVPIIVLEALGLIATPELSNSKRRELNEVVTCLLKWRVKTSWPALHHWQESARKHAGSRIWLEQYWRNRDTEPSRDRNQQVIRDVLEGMGLRRFHVKANRRSPYPVHARTPEDAQQALTELSERFNGAMVVSTVESTREMGQHDTEPSWGTE